MSITNLTKPSIIAGFRADFSLHSPIETIREGMQTLPHQPLTHAPWPAYPYQPCVSFSIAYTADSLVLHYSVNEKNIRAAVEDVNGPVWEDSCVEAFFAFDEGGYYNFEFNCIGAVLVGFGTGRDDRLLLKAEEIKRIRCYSKIGRFGGSVNWELTALLPFSVFTHHQLHTLKGCEARANFFKCGDAMPEPHYLCWSWIDAPEPDFHTPAFFGKVRFK